VCTVHTGHTVQHIQHVQYIQESLDCVVSTNTVSERYLLINIL
jgi:hypothetical protein